jgi:hypothetical protein
MRGLKATDDNAVGAEDGKPWDVLRRAVQRNDVHLLKMDLIDRYVTYGKFKVFESEE